VRLSGTRTLRAGNSALALIAFAILSVAPNYSARSGSLLSFSLLPGFGSPIKSTDTTAAVSHSARGLELQYQPFIEAFAEGNSARTHQAFAIFSLPNPADWFAKYFAKAQVEQLGRDNESELSTYERVLLRWMGAVPAGTKFRVHCKPPHADPTTRMPPRPDAIVPNVPIPVEQFVTEFDPIPKLSHGRFSILVNYVYVDGAFRYVGKGAYPFWSAPDEAQKKSMPDASQKNASQKNASEKK
jgi:hypothetical protein